MNNEELTGLLRSRGVNQMDWHNRGGVCHREVWGDKAFVRAVVEVSSYCRQNCSYCGMRRDNKELGRYRMEADIIREILFEHLPSSVTDINIQAGEDPVVVRELVIPLLKKIREKTSLGISVCLGTLDTKLYRELREAGADLYIIKLETGNAQHYLDMISPGTLPKRLEAIQTLVDQGWMVSSGYIHGLPGQTEEHVLETIRLLAELPLSGNSVSPFIAGQDTVWADAPSGCLETALNAVTAMRLLNPNRIIPAVSAMSILHPDGYVRALKAGANLTTINLTPEGWRKNYQLYKKDRFIMSEQRVVSAIEKAGLEPSTVSMSEVLRKSRGENLQGNRSGSGRILHRQAQRG
jgi:biotin synthase